MNSLGQRLGHQAQLRGDFDDRFDDARFRLCERFKVVHDAIETRAVGDPGISVDRAVFDQADDASEVGRQRVA